MITLKSIETARELCSNLSYRELIPVSKPGSVLADICRESLPTVLLPEEGDTLSAVEASVLRRSQAKDTMDIERHGSVMRGVVSEASRQVAGTLHYAKNVINPLIRETLEACQEEAQNAGGVYSTKTQIVPVEGSPVYFDPFLDTWLENTVRLMPTAKPMNEEDASFFFMDVTVEQIQNTLRLSNGPFGDRLNDLLLGIEPSAYTSMQLITTPISLMEINPYSDHQALLALLFLIGIKNGRHPAMDNADITPEEMNRINDAIDYYGFYVNKAIELFNTHLSNKTLINPRGSSYQRVEVIKDNYLEWTENGGSPEAILGFMQTMNDSRPVDSAQSDLKANPQAYAEMYTRSLKSEQITDRLQKNAAINRCIRVQLAQAVREQFSENDELKRQRLAVLDQWIRENPYHHSLDLDNYLLQLTCRVLSDGINDSFFVLKHMRGYLMDNPEAEPKEAAFFATASLVGKWVANQIDLFQR